MGSNGGFVVIADGDGRARVTAARALGRAGYETVEVDSASGALDAARSEGAVLLLLEVALPDMTGYEVCHELRQEDDQLPIFFLSGTRTEAIDRVAGLLLGADDFIAKPYEPAELVARVRRFVMRSAAHGHAPPAKAQARLTPREREVLVRLAQGKRQTEIAEALSIRPKTVATHIQSLLNKYGLHSRAELVAYAYKSEGIREELLNSSELVSPV